jgi:hypothetical protein
MNPLELVLPFKAKNTIYASNLEKCSRHIRIVRKIIGIADGRLPLAVSAYKLERKPLEAVESGKKRTGGGIVLIDSSHDATLRLHV